MRVILYTRPDGGLSVVRPVHSEQDAWNRLPMDAINPRYADSAEIPADRTFRNAWADANGRVEHDIEKCRAIHRDALRKMRAPLFAPLERAQRTALAIGDTAKAKEIEANLQALRDATDDPRIDAANTPEELKAVIPECLR